MAVSPTTNPAPALAPHRPLTEFYPSDSERRRFVRDLFDQGAPDYNWVSGVLSFGTDRGYRRHALRRAGFLPEHRLLDVATGTGLVAQAALDLGCQANRLVGIDPSRGMLAENARARPIQLVQGFGEHLPFGDGTFDFIVMGYALRHVEDLGGLFAEFRRVLGPGGKILILEISRPESKFALACLGFYMNRISPWITRVGRNRDEAARMVEYYWATIAECVPPEAILSALRQSGFSQVQRRRTGGILSDYTATKGVA
jgi:demethylmenaquinone methyltransferase/2-methoxy-6-polyprenyl-1,4-benzoquinol methylase